MNPNPIIQPVETCGWSTRIAGRCVSGCDPADAPQQSRIAHLRQLIAGADKYGGKAESLGTEDADRALPLWQTGVAEIDAALPKQGLSRGRVHEVSGQTHTDMPTAAAYLAALLKQLVKAAHAAPRRQVLWCQTATAAREFGSLYGAGLKAFGLDPDTFLFVQAAKNKDVLWALEEGARAQTLLAVVGEVDGLSFTHSRRLTLAATAGGTPVLVLRPHDDKTASAAETRWRLSARPGRGDSFVSEIPGHPCWQVGLMRSRGGRSGSWCVEWHHETHCFHLAEQFSPRCSDVSASSQHAAHVHTASASVRPLRPGLQTDARS